MGRMYAINGLCCSTVAAGAFALFALFDGNGRLVVDLLFVGVLLLGVAVFLTRRIALLVMVAPLLLTGCFTSRYDAQIQQARPQAEAQTAAAQATQESLRLAMQLGMGWRVERSYKTCPPAAPLADSIKTRASTL